MATFAQARPPGIYKGDYLKELFRRYDDIEDAPAPPPLPEWCFDEDDEEEDDDDVDNCKPGAQESEAGSSSSFSGKRRKEHLKLVMLSFPHPTPYKICMQICLNWKCLCRLEQHYATQSLIRLFRVTWIGLGNHIYYTAYIYFKYTLHFKPQRYIILVYKKRRS